MSVRVKICGIRSVDSAQVAIDAGADYLGLNFVPTSKRKVTLNQAKEIINAVRGKVKTVGIFKDSDIKNVNAIALALGLDYVQLHGNESTEYVKQVVPHVVKAVSFREKNIQEMMQDMYQLQAHYFLLDREEQGKGQMVDRQKTSILAEKFPVFLAGGLTPDNVKKAVEEVRPFGVDVAGGIETDGKEDLGKIKLFIKNAKEANI